jgi:hypothetical protein
LGFDYITKIRIFCHSVGGSALLPFVLPRTDCENGNEHESHIKAGEASEEEESGGIHMRIVLIVYKSSNFSLMGQSRGAGGAARSRLSVDNLSEHCELKPNVARLGIIVLLNEVGIVAGVLFLHQSETLADTLESEFVLGGVVIFVEFVVAVGVVIDQQSTAIDEDSRPLVLKALVLVFFSEMIFATLDGDVSPIRAEESGGEQVGETLVGKEVRLCQHVVSFLLHTNLTKFLEVCRPLAHPGQPLMGLTYASPFGSR